MPLAPLQYDAEVRDGNILAIYFIGMRRWIKRLTRRIDMSHQLMSKEIEVDPLSI